jgi:hypothetical protein
LKKKVWWQIRAEADGRCITSMINKEKIKKYPWKIRWDRRTAAIAKMIPINASVLDLGGGTGTLEKYLKGHYFYASIDLDAWTDKTLVPI